MSWDNLIEYSSFLGRCGNSKASLIFLMFVADCMQPIRLMLQCRVFPHLFVTWWPLRQPSSTIVNHRQPSSTIGKHRASLHHLVTTIMHLCDLRQLSSHQLSSKNPSLHHLVILRQLTCIYKSSGDLSQLSLRQLSSKSQCLCHLMTPASSIGASASHLPPSNFYRNL